MSYLNWMPENDRHLKKTEIEIHNKFHEQIANEEITLKTLFETPTRKFRIDALNEAIRLSEVKIKGKILEVGAGDGWCSAYVGRNYSIEEIYTMEINIPAVELLIPKVFKIAGVDPDKTKTVLGTFNNIPLKNHFDFVFVMGALHHSSNLYITFKNIYECLKPGGWLIAQEPYMINETQNSYYYKREEQEIDFKGITKVKNSDRTDLFYRECEYRVAGLHTGFVYNSSRVLKDAEKKQISWRKKTFPEYKDKPNNLVIYAQKPIESDRIPTTNWEENLNK